MKKVSLVKETSQCLTKVSAGKDCGCAAPLPPVSTEFEPLYYVAKLGLWICWTDNRLKILKQCYVFNGIVLRVHKEQINPVWISYWHEELYIMIYETFDTIFTITAPLKRIGFMSVSSHSNLGSLHQENTF